MTHLNVIVFTLDLQGQMQGESKFKCFLFFFYLRDLKPAVYDDPVMELFHS